MEEKKTKWKCDICSNGFDNFHAEGFDNKIYCPLCYFKRLYNDLLEENQQLKQKIKWYEADAKDRHLIPLEEKLEIVERYHKALNELASANKRIKEYAYQVNSLQKKYCGNKKRIDEAIGYIDEVKRVKQLDDEHGLNSTFDLELNLDNIKQILKGKEGEK